jgi:hypothetical protein
VSSGNPIPEIRACAFSLNSELLSESELEHAVGCTMTDASGAYTISELRPEAYAVTFTTPVASSVNFIPQLYDGKPFSAEPTPVSVPAGGTATNINAKLAPGARIAGRVTAAATGAPIERAVALAIEGTGENEQLGGIARTNSNGEYAINGLATGSYQVLFVALGYEIQFFDHKASPTEATLVAATAPELTSGIDAALAPESATPPGEGLPGLGAPGGEDVSGAPGTKGPGGSGGPRVSRPEGRLSLLHSHISVGARGLALVRLACAGRHFCRAKVTLLVKRTIRSKRHRRVLAEAIGTSAVLSIRGARTDAARVSLNAAGRKLLQDHGGSIDAELTLVTPGRTREQRVVLSAAGAAPRTGSRLTG